MPFGGPDFLASLYPSQLRMCEFLNGISYFLSLFPAPSPFKLSQVAEIRCVLLKGVVDVPFGGLYFSVPFHLLTVLNVWFFGQFF